MKFDNESEKILQAIPKIVDSLYSVHPHEGKDAGEQFQSLQETNANPEGSTLKFVDVWGSVTTDTRNAVAALVIRPSNATVDVFFRD